MASRVAQQLVTAGVDSKVAEELEILHKLGILSEGDLDQRAVDAIKEFDPQGAIAVLREFKDSNLQHVTNKSAYLCGVIKAYRQKSKSGTTDTTPVPPAKRPGPDEARLKAILDRTGYSLDVSTGQRKYGGPPPHGDPTQPGQGHEVFCGKIPKEIFEDELIPMFEKCGRMWDLRLMMDPLTGFSRGFCFVTFIDKEAAQEAVKQLNGHEIRSGKPLKVNISVANVRLFVGNIPKNKSKEDIMEEFRKHTDGLVDVIIYSSPDDLKKKNRGFAFLEYDSHKSASMAKRRLGSGWMRVWGCDIIVDWADPQEEPDDETMSKVKVLYVRNLKADVTEDQLREKFESYGRVERVKKVKDYGFVHFEERESALHAMNQLNGTRLGDSDMQISLAKPPTENKQKEKRKQQQRFFFPTRGYDDFWVPPYQSRFGGPAVRGRMPRPPMRGRGLGYRSSDYEFNYYNYKDYGTRGNYTDDDYYYGGGGGATNYDGDDYGYYGNSYAEPMPTRGRGGRMPPSNRGQPPFYQSSWQQPWHRGGSAGAQWSARR